MNSLVTKPLPKALFFGKRDCGYTQSVLQHLKRIGFDVQVVLSASRSEKLPEEIQHWTGDYIFCFRSYFFLKPDLLKRAKIAAINFHPAPVEYPGSGCLNWALYEGAAQYGVTAHIMNEKIDNGPIIECRRFPIEPDGTVDTLLAKTHAKSVELIMDITDGLALEGEDFLKRRLRNSAHESWRGLARKIKDLDRLQEIKLDYSKEETERVIRATHTANFPVFIEFQGRKFYLK